MTKANAKSIVHRRAYLDYVGIKTFDKKGALTGELRVVGLFTSTAYTRSVMKIPYLRSKAETVIQKSGFDPSDHSGKALINVLESYPRDELFQIAVPTLRKHAEAILGLVERPRVRALYRVDQFDRFVSVIVFVPRDRYDSVVREKIGDVSQDSLRGPAFRLLPGLPGRRADARPFHHRPLRRQDAEGRAGRDRRGDPRHHPHLGGRAARGGGRAPAPMRRCSPSRRVSRKAIAAPSPPPRRLLDARRVAAIGPKQPIAIDYYRHAGQPPERAALKIYHHGKPVALSRRVPVLENIGFKVISERTFEVAGGPDGPVFIHDMELENAFEKPIDLSDGGKLFEEVFLSVWRREADNDGYNALAQTAGLGASAIGILRAYGRYLQQAGIPQSQGFIAAVLNRYPDIARGLHGLFVARLDPAAGKEGEVTAKHLKAKIKDALEDVPNIDDDTIIRRYLNLIEASLRTNHFVPGLRDKGPVAGDQARFARGRRPARAAPVARDLRLRLRGRGRASALRSGGARRPALVGSRAGLPHRGARPRQGAAGQERRHRAGRRQGRLLSEALDRRPLPRPDLRGRAATPTSTSSPACCRSPTTSTAAAIVPPKNVVRRDPTIPISSSLPTRAPRPSPTPPTPSARSTASGSTTPSRPAARPATTTRRWASPPRAHGRR